MWVALTLAIGLAMDATAVAAARAVVAPRRDAVVLPLLFGGFQAAMAWLGWVTADWGGDWFAAWDHWIAFGLLAFMGGKMALAGWRGSDEADAVARPSSVKTYVVLAFATSADAGAAGVTLPLLPTDPWISVAWIGAVTAVLVAAGFEIGRRLGDRFGPKLEILGGVALIAIGAKILIEHLS